MQSTVVKVVRVQKAPRGGAGLTRDRTGSRSRPLQALGAFRRPPTRSARILVVRAEPEEGRRERERDQDPDSPSAQLKNGQGAAASSPPRGPEAMAPPAEIEELVKQDTGMREEEMPREDSEQVPVEFMLEEPGRRETEEMTPSGLQGSPSWRYGQAPESQEQQAQQKSSQADAPSTLASDNLAQLPVQVPEARSQAMGDPRAPPCVVEPKSKPGAATPGPSPDMDTAKAAAAPAPRSLKDLRVPSPTEASTLTSLDMEETSRLARQGEDPQEVLWERDATRALGFLGITGFTALSVYVAYEVAEATRDLVPKGPGEAVNLTKYAGDALFSWILKPKGPGETGAGLITALAVLGSGAYALNVARERALEIGERVRRNLIIFSRIALFAGCVVLIAYVITRE